MRNKAIINIIPSIILLLQAFFLMPTRAQFSIGPGGWVTVKEGSTLMIGSDFHIKSIAGSSGYFVDQTVDGDVTITGDITVDRYLSPDVWHNVASPVSSENSSVYAGTDLVFWYNESLILNDWNFGWVWYYGATGGPLVVFRGYDVLFYTNPVTINYQATGTETLNTGAYSITVINTSSNPSEIPSHKGWNLVGNPYPSPADWLGSGWYKSSVNDAKYIWDGTNDIYTIFIGGGSPIGINGGTRFIPSNQGFWVQSVVASGSFGISNSVRIGNITGTPDFYKLKPVDYPMVSLVASGGSHHSDEAVVRFLEGTTEGFDVNYDATKLYSLNPAVPQISIKHGKQVFALNTLPEIRRNLEVSLNFRCSEEGLYDIRLDPRTNLDDLTLLYLKDELLGKAVNLKADSAYTFYHDPSNAENRFRLYFNPYDDVISNTPPDSWFTVYTTGNRIHIIRNTDRELTGEIYLFNLLGQPVGHQALGNNENTTFQVNGPSGYYIVNIVTDQIVTNTKILICN